MSAAETTAATALAEFVVELDVEAIPAELQERLPWLVLDNIAAGLLGIRTPTFQQTVAAIRPLGGDQGCTVMSEEWRTDPARAAFLNGVAIGAYESGHGSWGAQPSGSVFPAVLALVESLGRSGQDLLVALAAGYEVNARVAQAQTNKAEVGRGFHNPAISGVFGSTAACAKLLELDLEQTVSAFGLAGSHAAGLAEFVTDGSTVKRIHLGRAAQMGLECALLARSGVAGPATVFEGSHGYLRAYSPAPVEEALTRALGDDWAIMDMFIKIHPVHGTSLAIVSGLDEWRRGQPDSESIVQRIDAIELSVASDAAEDRHNDQRPQSVMGAQYSVPFSAALTLVHGIDALCAITDRTLDDPAVLKLSANIRTLCDTSLNGKSMRTGANANIKFVDGSTESVALPGIPRGGLEQIREVSTTNVRRYAKGHAPDGWSDSVMETVAGLYAADHITELVELFKRAGA